MEIETITMDREEASERLVAYRRHLEGRHCQNIAEEYRGALAGYEALANGTPLINLQDAIRSGGFDEKMRPNLAVARADRKEVHFHWGTGWNSPWGTARFDTGRGSGAATLLIEVDMSDGPDGLRSDGYAIVPMSPPEAINAIGGGSNLRKHVILWEVEEWADRRISVMPDRDPLLLRLINGDLYAVMAQWDLTELERQVMTGRRNP